MGRGWVGAGALADVGEENDLLGEQFVSRGRPSYSKGQEGREKAYVTQELTTKVAYVHFVANTQ